jgi:type IV pilus assembly protein PilC
MPKFKYTALGADGSTVSGVESAASSGKAHLALRDRGMQPLTVTAKRGLMQFELTKKKVPRKDVMHFSRQLGVFVKAGIPILDALEVITQETTHKMFKKALEDMTEALQSGDTFAAAAAAHPEAFPAYYVGILNSAELTGNLDVVLNQLADYIERDTDARSKLTSALVYPGIVLGMSGVTVAVLGVFVMPKFQVFFKSLNAKLPLTTRMLLGFTAFVTTWWFAIAGIIIALVAGGIAMRRSPTGRAQLDTIILKLPVAGDLLQHAILERICRVLGSMMRAGVPLPEAMTVTADATNNAVYRRGLGKIREEMLEGQGLAGPLARTGLFPGAAQQMFRVGEETGTLDAQLQTAAAYYDRELDYKIKRFTALFEPAVIIIMGVVVGFVAVALVSAMYGIYKQVKV